MYPILERRSSTVHLHERWTPLCNYCPPIRVPECSGILTQPDRMRFRYDHFQNQLIHYIDNMIISSLEEEAKGIYMADLGPRPISQISQNIQVEASRDISQKVKNKLLSHLGPTNEKRTQGLAE